MPLNINNLTAGTPVTFNAQTSVQRMVFDSATVAFRIVNNTTGIVTVLEENSDSFICQVDPGATAFGLMQNAILVEAQYSGPVTITPYTWTPVSSTGTNTFTGGNKFIAPNTSSSGIVVQANGTISADEVVVGTNTTCIFQGIETTSLGAIHQFHSCGFVNVPAFYRTNGTYASKTPLLINDPICQIQFNGWRGTSFRTGGAITSTATENWSATNCGARLNFLTCADGSANARSALIVRQDGTTEPQFGIRFGSTGLSVLSNYEEGSWTPTFTGTGVTITYTSRVGSYRRIGNYVFVNATVVFATSTSTGAKVTVTGLPYTPLAGEVYTGSGILSATPVIRGTLTTAYNNAFRISAIANITADGEFTDTNISTCITNGYTMSINLTYKVA